MSTPCHTDAPLDALPDHVVAWHQSAPLPAGAAYLPHEPPLGCLLIIFIGMFTPLAALSALSIMTLMRSQSLSPKEISLGAVGVAMIAMWLWFGAKTARALWLKLLIQQRRKRYGYIITEDEIAILLPTQKHHWFKREALLEAEEVLRSTNNADTPTSKARHVLIKLKSGPKHGDIELIDLDGPALPTNPTDLATLFGALGVRALDAER